MALASEAERASVVVAEVVGGTSARGGRGGEEDALGSGGLCRASASGRVEGVVH